MKDALCAFGLVLTGSFVLTQGQSGSPGDKEACGFSVQGEPAQPSVTGPEDVLPLVYVVEQPDSPIEILSVDLEGMWLSVSSGEYTIKDCAKYKVRNRSDRAVRHFSVGFYVTTSGGGTGSFAENTSPIAPGQTMEITACGGNGHGGATDNRVRLLVSVRTSDFGNCLYRPSLRIPVSLGVRPVW